MIHAVGSRLAPLVLLAVCVLVATAAPAAAHGRGSDATNFSSRITDDPGIPGIRWEVFGGDEFLTVENDTDAELIVLGYGAPGHEPEPYLRIGPQGVFENRSSPAAYLNADRYAVVEVPEHADVAAEPDWVRVSGANRFAWHDHRIHYMGRDPSVVVPDPDAESVVQERWEVLFVYAGKQQALAGELRWVPGPSVWPWLLAALPLALLGLVGLRTRPEGGRWPGLARPAALVLGIVVLLNLSHLLDDLFAVPLPLPVMLLAAGQTVLFLAIGAFGAVRAFQAGEGAFTALGVGVGAILVGQGLLYWPVLGASQTASIFPEALARFTVAASIVQAAPLGAVAFIGTQRLLPPPPEEEARAGVAPEPA